MIGVWPACNRIFAPDVPPGSMAGADICNMPSKLNPVNIGRGADCILTVASLGMRARHRAARGMWSLADVGDLKSRSRRGPVKFAPRKAGRAMGLGTGESSEGGRDGSLANPSDFACVSSSPSPPTLPFGLICLPRRAVRTDPNYNP